ncbi:hypothetical protein Q1W71_13430 [Flavobacterium pectinovorum]|uniref:hypothetical protein n=1 Tax=Flavobacterium pectinovorum TaxID=29533 RepID=UPI00265F82D5|nr:hypothetical protein [Flavobacterium pectinovorum]WKL45959.1 hypothetical protein Q1W71_13430 [Flavobacterium pectinovorum]
MKNFLIYIAKIILVTILLAIVLDGLYSAMFIQCKNRGKIDQIYNSEGRKYDVVILGSSRANNHFVAPMFEEKGLKTFNYGMSGSHLFETALMLKLMIERKYQIKNVILEADLNLSGTAQAEGISSRYLPYIHNSRVVKNHFETQNNFNELYYIPFYRYIKYETRIGFREMFFNAIHKKTTHLDNLGYYPLRGIENGNMKNNITKLDPIPHNKYYEEIKNICKINHINLIVLMTPMCENVKGMEYFDKVKKTYPEIHNYENAIVENKYFSSCGHMNNTGAEMFTAIILKDFFNR